jgi:hypothetical protein
MPREEAIPSDFAPGSIPSGTKCGKAAKRGAGGGSRTLTGLLSPADFLTDYGFRRPDAQTCPIRFAVWTIPSPSPGESGA